MHKVSVTLNFEWKGEDPHQLFTLKEKLGEGAFASVYKGVHNTSGMVLAIKVLSEIEDPDELKREIDILKQCSHPNIISYFGTCEAKDNTFWILMDLAELGSARDLIDTCQRTFQEHEIAWCMLNTLKGLDYLHRSHGSVTS